MEELVRRLIIARDGTPLVTDISEITVQQTEVSHFAPVRERWKPVG